MQRKLKILVDEKSWINRAQKVPETISQLNDKTWNVNVLHALIFTAICTRPPVSNGLSLSDYWAWLRYGKAISTSSKLMLCKEWNTVDPHQKTVLSDELGIGFTTLLLAEKLGCLCFADTLYVVKKLFPSNFAFISTAKNGQKKTPDYIGFDESEDFYVLECKGTQASLKALQKAIEKGKEQKKNLSSTPGTKIKYQLVAGLFIPQWSPRSRNPYVVIADPSWEEIEYFFEQTPLNDIKSAIIQVNLAKHFSIAGLGRTAQFFAETPVEQLIALPEAVAQEIRTWLDTSEGSVRVLFDSEDIPTQLTPEPGRKRFQVEISKPLLVALLRGDIRSVLMDLVNSLQSRQEDLRDSLQSEQGRWRFSGDEADVTSAAISTPLGFRFTLEVG